MADIVHIFNDRIPDIIAALPELSKEVVKKAAFDIQATAKANVKVVTGFLKSSIYVVTMDSSTYGQRVVDGAPGSYLLPEVPKPTDAFTAYIAVGANYGVYVEFGTSKMAAQPYLVPAADAVAPSFAKAWSILDDYVRTLGVL